MPQQYETPDIPLWLRKPLGQFPRMGDKEEQFIITAPDGWQWTSNKGPQTWLLLCPYDEICCGGRRGGSKTAGLIAWMTQGDHRLDPDDPARLSYLNEPSFRGLFLRKEYQGMAEFVDECEDFFSHFGGKRSDDPAVFKFKSGAKVYTNHLGTADAFEKYRGQGITKIGIEELTQIEDEHRYKKLFGSLRNKKQIRYHKVKGQWRKFPKLHCQIMSTTNPDGVGRCVPYGDVLTPNGWVPIQDVKVGQHVWSVDPVTGEMVLKQVDQVHSESFDGELYVAKSRGVHVACTPNHKILRFNTTKKDRKLVLQEIEKFPGQAVVVRTASWQKGLPVTEVRPEPVKSRPSRHHKSHPQPQALSAENFCEFVGWMVSEGSLVRRDNALCISQQKPEGVAALRAFLDGCGFRQNWGKTGVLIYSHTWLKAFDWLEHSHNKYIPQWVKDLPTQCLERLIAGMMAGDGHWKVKSDTGHYYTTSARLASDFCEIALKCGYMINASGRTRNKATFATAEGGKRTYEKCKYAHEISIFRQTLGGSELRTGHHVYDVESSTKRTNTERVPFSGPVYCVGVPDTHTFIIRQHGCVWVSGNSWVKNRFIHIPMEGGGEVPWNYPAVDPITKLTRIFIPMRREDNPYLRDDKEYEGKLLEQDAITRRQWMDGDWDAQAGLFFESYRPNGPVGVIEAEQYPWARHIPVKPPPLKPWWLRWGSLDIGYDHPSVAYKAVRNQDDKRIHVYDEFWARKMDSYELGVALAQWWLPDLEKLPDHQVVIYVSPDAFSKTDADKSKAERLELGMKEILGPYGAVLLRFNEAEREYLSKDPERAKQMFQQRREQFHGKMGIAIKSANDNRRDGCDYMQGLLRWRPSVTETEQQMRERLEHIYGQYGLEAYEKARVKSSSVSANEILPKVQIWSVCTDLDRCLKQAEHDVRQHDGKSLEQYKQFNAIDGDGGDDALDSFRYLCMGYKDLQVIMPREYFVEQKMQEAQQFYIDAYGAPLTDPTRLAMIAMTQDAKYDKMVVPGKGSIHLPRVGSMRHRHNPNRVN